jgi:dolichol kinase
MMIRIALPRGTVWVPPPRYAPPHFRCSWVGSGALVVALLLAAAVWLRRRALAGRGRVRMAGTILLAGGVVAVVWDTADDVVRGGLWAASIGDAAVIGVAAVSLGTTMIWAARPSSARGLE